MLGEHLFWITSRAAGIAALLLASAAVGLGLALGGRLAKARTQDLRPLHEALSLATLTALVVHAVSLLGDGFLHPTVTDIAIPFAGSYQRFWQGAGIVAGWMLLALGLSFYARARIGVQRWRSLHRWTALAWVLSIGHSLGEGTDAGRVWFLAAAGMVVLPTLWLLVERHAGAFTTPAHSAAAPRAEPRPVAPRSAPTAVTPRGASEARSLWRG